MFAGSPLSRWPLALALGLALVLALAFALRRRGAELESRGARRALRGAAWVVAGLPWVWLGLFGSLVVRARLASGAWPRREAAHQDLGDAGLASGAIFDPRHFPVHRALVASTFVVLLLAPLLAAMLAIVGRVADPSARASGDRAMLLALAGALLALLLLTFDFGGFVEWFLG